MRIHQLQSLIRKTKLLLAVFLLLVSSSSVILCQKDSYIDSLRTIINKEPKDTLTVSALIDLSFYIVESDPLEALKYSREALSVSEKLNWEEGIAWSTMQIALSYDYQANYDTAMFYYRKTFDKRRSMNDRNGMAGVLFNAGGSYHYRGIYSIAMNYYLKALALYQSTGNEIGIARCYSNLGSVARIKKDYQQSLNYYLQVKFIREKNKDVEGMMFVYNNISSLFSYLGNYRASIDYAEKSAAIARELDKKVDLANALLNIGTGYLAFNDLQKSEKHLKESKTVIDQTNDQQYRSYILAGLGELYLKKSEYNKTFRYLDSAVVLATKQQRLELLTKCYKLLSRCYEKTGEKDKSLEYYKKFDALSDTILNQENLRQMNEMEAVYKISEAKKENNQLSDEKRKESIKADRNLLQRNIFIGFTVLVILISLVLIGLIRKNIRIRKELSEKTEIIESSLREKEVLLKEIHHRIKNNLQLVSSLLQLQINRTTDTSTIDALIESQTRIESMAMIHKHLYGNDNLGNIDMKMYLEQLVLGIEKTYKKPATDIQKLINIQSTNLNMDTAVPLGIIATELISNCYKYAFLPGRKNTLLVDFKKSPNDEYVLKIQDNGAISMDLSKISSSTDSLGLKLVSLMTKQLRAEIVFENNNGLSVLIKGKQLV